MRALNRDVERVFSPSRKDPHGAAASWRATDKFHVLTSKTAQT
jgi:hypothetical protein